jgi:hypothetical protein
MNITIRNVVFQDFKVVTFQFGCFDAPIAIIGKHESKDKVTSLTGHLRRQ